MTDMGRQRHCTGIGRKWSLRSWKITVFYQVIEVENPCGTNCQSEYNNAPP